VDESKNVLLEIQNHGCCMLLTFGDTLELSYVSEMRGSGSI
jgi:hypothetical protein